MLSALWSAKGGAGTTTTAVALADIRRRSHRTTDTLLVDLAGDLPAALGLGDPDLGATEWLASDAGPEALTRIERDVADGVSLLPLGNTSEWPEARSSALVGVLGADHRDVVVDAGLLGASPLPLALLRERVTDAADRSLLVTRSCYLALRRAARCGRTPDGVILIRESGRALDRGDVEGLLSVPVVAEVDSDPAVARAIDAGLLLTSGPRHVARALRRVAVSAADTVEERVRQGYLDLLDRADEPRSLIEAVLTREAPLLAASQADEVVARVVSQVRGLGAIDQVWSDDSVTDILINGPGPIWVERHGSLQRTPWTIDADELGRVVERVFGRIGVRVDRAQPIADGRLEDGSRISVVLPPVALDGPVVSIRRFAVRAVELGAFATHAVIELLDELIAAHVNVMVYGGTGSGKTTLLNAIASRFGRDDRVITVEDAAELRLPGDHVVGLESRRANSEGAGVTTIRDLVRAALRLRPDRIVVGEVRGAEALDMVWAMSSGHDGSMTTIHASSAFAALRRLETFVAMDAVRLPHDAIRAQIGSAIDVLVGVERSEGGGRRITAIDEVTTDGGTLSARPLARDGVVVDHPHRRVRRGARP